MSSDKTLTFGSLTYRLELVPPEKVYPHEEVIEEITERLKSDIIAHRAQIDPIISDAKSGVILDGMHRLEALNRLEARLILSCTLNYEDDSIKVCRWIRCLSNRFTWALPELAESLSLGDWLEADTAVELVDHHNSAAALILGEKAMVSDISFRSTLEAYDLVRAFDRVSEKYSLKVSTIGDNYLEKVIRDSRALLLYTRPIGKADVLESGTSHRLFPPKSTRHIIPARPVGLNFPLDLLLLKSYSVDDAEKHLDNMLRRARFRVLPPGAYYQGRTYEDTLMIFEGEV